MKKPGCIALFALFAAGFAPAATGTDPVRIRQALADSAAAALASAPNPVPAGELGAWDDTLKSALFLLFRKTELYRGALALRVVDSPDAGAELFAGGEIVVTSGLLDLVDGEVFERASRSSGRARDFTDLRERYVVPYLAFEAARFALDQPYLAATERFRENPGAALTLSWAALTAVSDEQAFLADRMAEVLLASAGYDANLYPEWLSSLDSHYRAKDSEPLARYLSAYPSPARRIESLAARAGETADDIAAARAALRDLRTGIGTDEMRDSLGVLASRYPTSTWVVRLRAFGEHLAWLESVKPEALAMATVMPFAREGAAEFERLAPLLEATANPSGQGEIKTAGNAAWTAATVDYKALRGAYGDPSTDSALATLLAYSGNGDDLALANRLSASAAAAEGGGPSFVARANRALVVLLTGKDPLKASFLLEALVSDPPTDRSLPAEAVSPGSPGDSRILILNAILSAGLNGDRATALRARLLELAVPDRIGPLLVRGLTNGDNADTLIDKWGHPAEIEYNIEAETWYYPALSAEVSIGDSVDGARIVKAIRVAEGSPVSPGADVRVGDTRAAFEGAFGAPSWVSGDRDVYLVNGNRISVFYLGGDESDGSSARIRELSMEFAEP